MAQCNESLQKNPKGWGSELFQAGKLRRAARPREGMAALQSFLHAVPIFSPAVPELWPSLISLSLVSHMFSEFCELLK